ncbi:MAG: SH3 domain-containing protein [Christensenellales bacterium]|jgi:hypothetical protein
MKRFVVVCLCLLAIALGVSALERPPLHPDVIALCKKAYPEYTITASDGFGDDRAGQWALVLTKGEEHVLAVAEKAGEEPGYRFTVENSKAIMPGDSHPSVLIDTAGDALFIGFQDKNHRWDFSAVKNDGAWGHVAATVWGRNIIFPVSEWHMWVEEGQLISTYIESDDNDNTLSSTSYPPFPVPHLAGKTALDDYDWAAFPINPWFFMDSDSPERNNCLNALMPEGWQLTQATLTPTGIFLLGEDAQGDTRLLIKTWVPERKDSRKGIFQDTLTRPLPRKTWMDSCHMSDGLLLLRLEGIRDYAFHQQKGNLWGLSQVMSENGLFSMGPDYMLGGDAGMTRYCFGNHPWGDISTLDMVSLPQSYEEAVTQLNQSGWAKVNNPNPNDRLHLRTAPERTAKSLGKYYNGTPVKVLGRQGDWVQVDIAGVSGFMMADYLAFDRAANAVDHAFPELVGLDSLSGRDMPLYARPDEASRVLYDRSIQYFHTYWIIGLVGEEWYHVYFFREGIGGYMKREWFYEGNG